jgi:hypothetical protein
MSSQPIRIEARTLRALRERSAQSGEPLVRLAQRYIDEGMRLDRHNGVVFRDGPAGRRAVVVGGPDVWEVIMAARDAPERGEELIRELAERLGVPSEKIRIAIRYYAEYRRRSTATHSRRSLPGGLRAPATTLSTFSNSTCTSCSHVQKRTK